MQIIAGKLKGRTLKSPKGQTTRPTQGRVKKSLFDILKADLEGSHFLDIFAGSGQIGIEALSRGASHAIFIENNRLALSALKQNLQTFNLSDHSQVMPQSALRALTQLEKQNLCFDLIFLDPPYGQDAAAKTLLQLDSSSLYHPQTRIFLEESSKFTPPPLTKLQCSSSRNYGDTTLFEFQQTKK